MTHDRVSIKRTGSETDGSILWKPLIDGFKVVFQNEMTGGFLTKSVDGSYLTTEVTAPTTDSEFYWVEIPQ